MSPINPHFREIFPEDYELLVRFFVENNVPEITRMFHPFSLDEKSALAIACGEHLDRFYVALHNNMIISFCMLRGWDEGYSVPSYGVLVDRRFQHYGVGRKITLFAIEEAKRLGCNQVRLSVYASNNVAHNLYISMGFVEDNREVVQVAGETDEKITMHKNLLNLE